MKKKVVICFAMIFIVMSAMFVVPACTKKSEMKGLFASGVVYDAKGAVGWAPAGLDPTLTGAYLQIDSPLWLNLTYRSNVTVKDVKDLPKDSVVYTTEDVSALKNKVVVSKWLYYYSLMVSQGKTVAYYTEHGDEIKNAVESDEFCMEKAALTNEELWNIVDKDGDEVFFDKDAFLANLPPYPQAFREEIGKVMNEMISRNDMEILSMAQKEIIPATLGVSSALFYEYAVDRSQLKVAAMQRYGLIDVNEMEKGVGKLKVWYDTDEPKLEKANVYYSVPVLDEVSVVGYYETEADKLMSTGVKRDVKSEEYKLVFEQLWNPTIYIVK